MPRRGGEEKPGEMSRASREYDHDGRRDRGRDRDRDRHGEKRQDGKCSPIRSLGGERGLGQAS